MRIALFSDVHANLIALEKFISATRDRVDAYLCLGDVVNYGPWNDECLQTILGLPGIVLLEGNHERLFRGVENLSHELPLVQDFFYHSRRFFSRPDLIAGLAAEIRMGTFLCTHTIGGRSIYADTAVEIDRDYMIGHTHHQFTAQRSGFRIVNPGSIGQNRKWIDMADYAIFETETGQIDFHSIPYDIDLFLAELRQRGYPRQCLAYYEGKSRFR